MLRSSLKIIRRLSSQAVPKQPKLISIKVQYQGTIYPFAFPLHTKLAKNLEKAGVPLQFQCGFGCSCGTCAVKFSRQDFQKILKDQPIAQKQQKVLKVSTQTDGYIRLSCQLFIMEYFEGMLLKIQ